ncbi:MAG: peptidoglycan-binding protein [Myxococcaceae bacterium]|nr:peptidoglycan-binding protein [Myxococcaceae bacterium]
MRRAVLCSLLVVGAACGPEEALPVEGADTSSTVEGGVTVNPITPDVIQIGYHVLSYTSLAEREYQRGARFFVSMDDVTGAKELKRRHPDAIVMVRVYLTAEVPPSVVADRLGVQGDDPGLVYVGHNEADLIGQSLVDLPRRAAFDLALAALVKQRSAGRAKYAAGTFSMGTPDFTDPAVCQKIKSLYAPAYNRGDIVFDMHLYSPRIDHLLRTGGAEAWYERRWEFLFTDACGFDPKVRGIYSSETGLDEGGVGGFVAHDRADFFNTFKNTYQATVGQPFTGGYPEYVTWWVRRFKEVSARPVVRGGVTYPSPFIGGAIFQLGNTHSGHGGWSGYNMEPYVGAMAQTFRPDLAPMAVRGQVGELPLPGASGGGGGTPTDPLAGARARIAAYVEGRRLQGSSLGTPVDNGGGVDVHAWGPLVVQDFSGGITENRAVVVDSAAGTYAVINGFYRGYQGQLGSLSTLAPMHLRLGAPRGDERWVVDHVEQPFQYGQLRWSSARGVWARLDVPPLPPGALARGATGPAVLQLQQALVRLLFLTPADLATGPGLFGPRTQAAVTGLQAWLLLPKTGSYDAGSVAPALKARLQP